MKRKRTVVHWPEPRGKFPWCLSPGGTSFQMKQCACSESRSRLSGGPWRNWYGNQWGRQWVQHFMSALLGEVLISSPHCRQEVDAPGEPLIRPGSHSRAGTFSPRKYAFNMVYQTPEGSLPDPPQSPLWDTVATVLENEVLGPGRQGEGAFMVWGNLGSFICFSYHEAYWLKIPPLVEERVLFGKISLVVLMFPALSDKDGLCWAVESEGTCWLDWPFLWPCWRACWVFRSSEALL